MHLFYFCQSKGFFVCYHSENEITNDNEMKVFMASSLEFGIGHTKESALDDLNFNLAGTKNIKLQG